MTPLTYKGETLSYSQILDVFKEWVAPIYVTPASFLVTKYEQMHGVVGIITFVEDTTGIHVDWSVDTLKKSGRIYPELQNGKYFCSDLRILWHPGMNTDIPASIIDRLEVGYRPMVNKIANDIVVINPASIKVNDYLKQWKRHIGIVKPMKTIGGTINNPDEIMVIMSETTLDYDPSDLKYSIGTPKSTSWIKLERDQCICIPDSFTQYIGMNKKFLSDGSSALITTTPTKKVTNSTDITFETKPKFQTGDIVAVQWDSDGLKDKRLFGTSGIVVTSEKEGNSFIYSINFDIVPNQSLALCKGIDADVFTRNAMVPEYCLSDLNTKNGFTPIEQLAWRTSIGKEIIHTAWDVMTRQPIIITSITDGATIYAKEQDKQYANEFKGNIKQIDYNYDPEKLKLALESCDFLLPAIETHNKQEYVYVYGFDEFSENANIMLRIFLGKAVDKKRNLKKLRKWMENSNGQSMTSVLKYLEPKNTGNIFHTLDKVYLTTKTFSEAK